MARSSLTRRDPASVVTSGPSRATSFWDRAEVFPDLAEAARFTLTSCATTGDGVLLLEYSAQ
jgi:hypothetical protein